MTAKTKGLVPTRRKFADRQWQCPKCNQWHNFGGWYAAHSREILTVTCPTPKCGVRYGTTSYDVWPL